MVFLLALLMLAMSTLQAQEPVVLPKPEGPYGVGTQGVMIEDPARVSPSGKGPRRWMQQLFYPTPHHHKTFPYMPGTIAEGVVQGTQVLSYAQPQAKPVTGMQFPVIIFIPGFGGERQKYTILCEALASHGFVVIALELPSIANFVRFPTGETVVPTLKDIWQIARDRDYRYRRYDESMATCIADIRYALDHLNDLTLSTIIDSKQLILMGHSFGGNVAHTLGFQDHRVKAIVDIDSKITERPIYGRIGVPPNVMGKPVLFIRAMMQYQEDVGDQLHRTKNATVWAPLVQHSAFSDAAFFADKIPSFGRQSFLSNLWNWMFARGPYWDRIDTSLGAYNTTTWYHLYTSNIIQWLKK